MEHTTAAATERSPDHPPLPQGFRMPDFTAPLDVDAHPARVPEETCVRGMFFAQIQQEYRRRELTPPTTESFQPFGSYPMRRLMELLVEAAGAVHPGVPTREGLRRLGHGAHGVFACRLPGLTEPEFWIRWE